MDRFYIGVDLGGTHIRTAGVSASGSILARERIKTCVEDGYNVTLGRIRSSVESVREIIGYEPQALGIAVAGAVDFESGVITKSPNFPGWVNAPLREDMASLTGFDVVVDNDASLAAVGEGWLGAGENWPDFIVLTLGTGVGGGITLGGKLWRGQFGMAGEIGHIAVDQGGAVCACGAAGCLETRSSANAVAQTAAKRINEPQAQWLRNRTDDDADKITAELITLGAMDGEEFCIEILRTAGVYLGKAIAQCALILNISKYIIGGGMAPALPFLAPSIRQTAIQSAYTLTDEKLVIVPARLGDDAGILGAVKLAMED